MSIAILHLCGDANVPPVRVPSTVALARTLPPYPTVYVAVEGPEAIELAKSLGAHSVHEMHGARDTVDEITITMRAILASGSPLLYISTEPGHVWRATLAARILYLGRGVRIVPWSSAPGTYRSPWYDTARTILKAVRRRVVG